MSDPSEKQMYLELLKKTILNEIYFQTEAATPEIRKKGRNWPVLAHSMIGRDRMDHLQKCMETVLEDKIDGDFIETGVWRGGACIFMRGFLKVHGIKNRRVWVADSFEGLPEPDEVNYPLDKGFDLHTVDYLKVSLESVKKNFVKYDLLDEQVCFLKGWFKDTLPTAPIEKISIARLDGDMYSSTMDSLINLYPKVSLGGYIIIDDYGAVSNCKAAVTDFRKKYNIEEPLINIDWTGVYWRKTK